jgi:putative transposase
LCASAERRDLIEKEHPTLSVVKQAKLLDINRSSIYYKPVGTSPEELTIKHRIDEIYTKHPYYGSRRITASLNREGFNINRKAVQRHMREMGISGVCPGPNLSRRNHQHSIYPYLLRDVPITHPNHVWGIDITYIRLASGWMYLVAIIDWYSRFIVSWELSSTLDIDFVLQAQKQALARATAEIANSDQGSHFTSPRYVEVFKRAGTKISMNGKGRALDNIYTERFFRSLKWEEVYLKEYQNPRHARTEIAKYINFYNNERPHQELQYHTPAEVYTGSMASVA